MSSHSTDDKLVYMANQIGTFFVTQDGVNAAERIAEHIRKFWDPRMRSAIIAHLDAGGEGLNPSSRKAIEMLRDLERALVEHVEHDRRVDRAGANGV
jgi:formate dehydrogenase subunit delta